MEVSGFALWLNSTFGSFDASAALFVHKLYDLAGAFFTPFFEGVSLVGKGGILLILLSLALMLYRPTRRCGTAMCLGLAIGALATNLVLKVFIARPRPYLDEAGVFHQLWLTVGQHTESDKSFPSGHVTAAADSMTPVILIGRKQAKIPAALLVFLMCVARIYLCVHYATDVLGGLLVGVLAGCLAVLIAKKLPDSWYHWDLRKRTPGKHEHA